VRPCSFSASWSEGQRHASTTYRCCSSRAPLLPCRPGCSNDVGHVAAWVGYCQGHCLTNGVSRVRPALENLRRAATSRFRRRLLVMTLTVAKTSAARSVGGAPSGAPLSVRGGRFSLIRKPCAPPCARTASGSRLPLRSGPSCSLQGSAGGIRS
jgi:hypothetical protein